MSQFAINLLWFVRLSFMAEMLTQLLKVVVLKSFVWLNGTGYFRMWQNNWLSIARTASCQSTLNISLLLVWQLFATGICNSPVWITEHTKEVNTMFCTPKHHTCKLKIFKTCYLQQKDLSKWFFLVLTQQKYLQDIHLKKKILNSLVTVMSTPQMILLAPLNVLCCGS